MFCSNCGVKIDHGEAFCSSCGAATGGVTVKFQGQGLAPESKKLLLILAGAVFVLLIVILVVSSTGGAGGKSSPQAAIEAFFKAFQRGNAKQMVELMNPEELQGTGFTKDYMVNTMGAFISEIDLKSYQVLKVDMGGDDWARATVQITAKFRWRGEDFLTDTIYYDLARINGKWYVSDDIFRIF